MDQTPAFETRAAQPYVGKRVILPLHDFSKTIPALLRDVAMWMADNGVEASGKPFVRYHVIDMPRRMDIEVAFPVADLPNVKGVISRGILPPGRYATLTYIGVENAIAANAKLIAWVAENGARIDCERAEKGEAFAGRIERLLSVESGQDDGQTQIAIKTRGG